MKKTVFVVVLSLCVVNTVSAKTYLGQLSRNKHTPNSTSGYGSNNYRVKQSMQNRYSSDGPKAYDSNGNFRGNLNGNRYDPDSVSNPYGQYGSRYSADSINNPYGAGSRYQHDSPNNPYGSGWSLYDD